ncbi:MAG: glycosyltransferase family 39 protein [Anaerolineae bacterium]|nr:glycosyltransferase family 39 protein [Anaerolineae bacterium]
MNPTARPVVDVARRSRWRWVGLPLLLLLLLVQMAASSARKSAAFDETYHLVSGYAYLHTGDPRLSWEHPPLAQVLSALPLLRMDGLAPFPFDHPAWQRGDGEAFVDDYLWLDNAARAAEMVWAGRWPLMLLTLLFGLGLFAAMYTSVGEWAAWLGLTLFILDPNVVANGRLIGNDLPMAGFMLLAVWRLGVYLQRPSWPNLLLAGGGAGLAVATKLSAGILAPMFVLLVVAYRPASGHVLSLPRRLLALVGMGLVAALVVWAVFGFEVGPVTASGVPLPAPTFLRGLPGVWRRIARGTPTFLLGRVSDTGWWYYFPAIFVLKTPLPTLVLLAVGAGVSVRRWRERALWWVPLVFYLVVASAGTLQIGYRYILPVLLFAIPLAAEGAARLRHARWARFGLILLLLWAAADAALVFPDHLSYANALAGGPDNSWRVFADMNVDWGQDLVALREYVDAHDLEDVRLAYFGSAYPSAYGVDARLLPSFSRLLVGAELFGFNPYTPDPGTYAISATSLHLGLIYDQQDLYAAFRDREPDARAGRSILIYEVEYPAGTPVDRTVVVGPGVSALTPEELGLVEGHRLVTKWSAAGGIVLAAGGPARYVVRDAVPEAGPVADVLAAGPVVDARPFLERIPAAAQPTTPEGEPVALPAAFDGGPALVGWSLAPETLVPGQSVTLVTYWRVAGPLPTPLAVFVHVLGSDGLPVTQWDGWPVAASGLEQGDVIVLAHPLPLPGELAGGTYTLQVGLYRPPHGPRLEVAGGDRLILDHLAVE